MNYLKGMDDKYWPRTVDEMVEDPIPVTVINEPVLPNVVALPPKAAHSLHAVLCDALTSSRGLLQRLESGVRVGREGEARAAVRDLYVQIHCAFLCRPAVPLMRCRGSGKASAG